MVVVGAAAGLCAQGAAAATLTADYQFQNNLSSSVPGASDMLLLGSGTYVTETVGCGSRRVLTFPKGSGVEALNPNSDDISGNYSFAVDFRLSDPSGARRIFDPSGSPATFSSDDGVYSLNNRVGIRDFGQTYFGSLPDLEPDAYAEVAFGWSDEKGVTDTAYLNGTPVLSYLAADSANFYARYLRFFRDNDSGGATDEESAGAVTRVRIYEGIITPAEAAAAFQGSGLAGACNPSKRARVAVNGKVRVRNGAHGHLVVLTGIDATCPAGGRSCRGSASVSPAGGSGRLAVSSRAPKKLGKGKLKVKAGKSKNVKVKLSGKGSDALREAGKLRAKIKVRLAVKGGLAAVATRTAKLKAPKHT
jgi:hypothetical protein